MSVITTEVRRDGPVMNDPGDIADVRERAEAYLDDDDQVVRWRFVEAAAHAHTPSCPDWGAAARGDFECGPQDVDLVYEVTRRWG